MIVTAPAARTGETAVSSETDLSGSSWDTYVTMHPGASLYHTQRFRQVFERAFGHACHYLSAVAGTRVCGVLPIVEFKSRLFGRFGVSLPFVNYGGVLADEEVVARDLVARACALALERKWAYLELRHTTQHAPEWPSRRHKVGMTLALPSSIDDLSVRVDRKVRNLVRKAEKAGCIAEDGHAELLPDFYAVFAHNMRDLGTPVYSRTFFEEVVRAAGRDARVFVVRDAGVPVAAAITLSWRDTVEVPWASSLRSHAGKSPNMLLYWSMLRRAIAEGARTFDFGRSTPGEGTYHFKRQWGAEPQPMVWEYPGSRAALPDHSPKNPKFRLAVAAWRRMPVPLATLLGPAIVRNIP